MPHRNLLQINCLKEDIETKNRLENLTLHTPPQDDSKSLEQVLKGTVCISNTEIVSFSSVLIRPVNFFARIYCL